MYISNIDCVYSHTNSNKTYDKMREILVSNTYMNYLTNG